MNSDLRRVLEAVEMEIVRNNAIERRCLFCDSLPGQHMTHCIVLIARRLLKEDQAEEQKRRDQAAEFKDMF